MFCQMNVRVPALYSSHVEAIIADFQHYRRSSERVGVSRCRHPMMFADVMLFPEMTELGIM